MKAVESSGMWMDCKVPGQSPPGITANMVCQKPRDFRLTGVAVGQSAVDIGSNKDEFWFWVRENAQAPVYHCSYDDMSRGQVRLPFPFQPDMVVRALGMAEYKTDPANYKLKEVKDTLELSEPTTLSNGQPGTIVTVISRMTQRAPTPQVIAYALKNDRGEDVCRATILATQFDKQSNAVVPQRVKLYWSEQKTEVTLTLNALKVYPTGVSKEYANQLFVRREVPGRQSIDLARMSLDAPASPSGISRVRGAMP
jgi:hypothetical protein